ncbi:MAG: hypothetical protein AAGA77_07690 [Bacteroidota bacterium]
MKYSDFEKHIKNELEGSKENVQMDALLSSLNLGEQPKRRAGGGYWKFIPVLFLAFSVLAWIFIAQPNKKASSYVDIELPSQYVHEEVENNESILPQEENLKEDIKTKGENEALQNTTNSFTSSIDSEKSTTEKTNSNRKKSDIEKETVIDKINTTTTTEASMKVMDTSSASSHHESSRNNSVTANGITSKPMVQKASLMEKVNSSNSESIASRNFLSIKDLETTSFALNTEEVDGNLFSRMKINCPSFDNAGWHMALIPEVGLFYPSKTLESSSNPEEPLALDQRLSSESTLEGLEIGLYGMLVRDKMPFYIKAGISYSRIAERMDLQYEYTEQDTTIGIISSTVSDNGDTITHIYGDIITETTFKGSNRQHYYIHLFDVPISVGYTTYIGGLDVGIEGGVRINFMTRATGNLLTSQSEYTNLSLNRLFKSRIGLSYFGGLMIGRNFGRYGDFYIAPRFTYFPNDFNNANNAVRQRYFNIGLNVGMVYKID